MKKPAGRRAFVSKLGRECFDYSSNWSVSDMLYGDFPLPDLWPPEDWSRESMTAIVRMLTSSGFVFAADGRARDGHHHIVSDDCQKIFPVAGRPLAYAVFGYTGIGNEDSDKILVDVCLELKKAAMNLGNYSPADLVAYGEKLVRPIYNSLLKAKDEGALQKYPGTPEPHSPDCEIFAVWILGYFAGLPSEVMVKMSHREQRLRKPVGRHENLWLGYPPKIMGSPRIDQLLYHTNDHRFATFRRPLPSRPEDLTLDEAIQVASNYIRACDSPEGRSEDPDLCPGIGGRIQIATVTPSGVQGYQPEVRPGSTL
jgi:hypothetical protein